MTTTQTTQDQAEAADLQSWLVGNARHVRPVSHSGLMAWALAALKSQQALLLELSLELSGDDIAMAATQSERIQQLTEAAGALRVRNANIEAALAGLLHEFDDGVNGGRQGRVPALDYARTLVRPAAYGAEPKKACGGCGNACSEVRP